MPHATADAAGERTSLQVLQALEKGSTDGKELVTKITKILDNGSQIHFGRYEWVARWLLKKLKDFENAESVQLRGTPEIWQLMSKLITALPGPAFGRHLGAGELVSVLSQTLQENALLNWSSDIADPKVLDEALLSISFEIQQQYGTKPTNGSNPLKRKSHPARESSTEKRAKRDHSSQEVRGHDSKNQEINRGLPFLEAVSACVEILISKCDDLAQNGDSFSAESLRVLLQADAEVSCQFLANWMKVVSNHMWSLVNHPDQPLEGSGQPSEPGALDMSWVLRIWRERASKSSSAQDIVAAFTKICAPSISEFMPLSMVLAGTTEHPLAFRENLNHTTLLLAKHVVLPARSAHHQSKPTKLDVSTNFLGWRESLQLIYQNFEAEERQMRHFKLTLATLVVLFQASISCTPLTGSKALTSESPWLEAVFTELVSCAELVLTKTDSESIQEPSTELCDTIEQLLKLANRHGLKFSRSTLRRLAIDYGGIFKDEAKKIHRSILSVIMHMDSAVFTGQHERQAKSPSKEGDLTTAYFRSLSRTCLINPVDNLRKEKPTNILEMGIQEAGKLVHELVNQRNINRFVQYWHAELMRNSGMQSSTAAPVRTLWETPSMTVILQPLLGSSITEQQWLSILQERSISLIKFPDIENAKETVNESELFADICITTLVLHAIEDDKSIDQICSFLQNIQLACLDSLRIESLGARSRSKIWQLFSIARRLLLRSRVEGTSSKQNDLNEPAKMVHETVSKLSSEPTLDRREEACSAVAALCNIVTGLVSRHMSLGEVSVSGSQLLHILRKLSTGNEHQKLLAHDMALLIARSPYFIRFCAEEQLAQDVMLACFFVSLEKVDLSQTPWALLVESVLHLDMESYKQLRLVFQQALDANTIASFGANKLQVFEQLSRTFLKVDAVLVPKSQRALYIEMGLEILSTAKSLSHEIIARLLSVILRFVSVTCDKIPIASDLAQLSKAGKELDRLVVACDKPTQEDLFTIWEGICLSCIRHYHSKLERDGEGGTHGLTDLLAWSENRKASLKIAKSVGSVCMLSSKQSSKKSQGLENALQNRADHVGKLLSAELKRSSKSMRSVSVSFIADLFEFLSILDAGVLISIPDLDESLLAFQVLWDKELIPASCFVRSSVVDCKLRLEKNQPLDGKLISSILSKRNHMNNKRLIESILRPIFTEMTTGNLIETMNMQLELCQNAASLEGSWAFLNEIIGTGILRDEFMDAYLVLEVLRLCCHQLHECSSAENFYFACGIIEDVLQSHGKIVAQISIDQILHCLTILVSPSSPNITSVTNSEIYKSVCRVANTVLSLYRRRWKGRFNLIIPLLQGALRCLFSPALEVTQVDKRLHHPIWLLEKSLTRGPLQAEDAERFTRLLTAICEPSASSVTKHHKNKSETSHALVDETKRARDYAGNYVPLILVEFCNLQLIGRLPDGVRKAIMPGLFACFNVMSEKSINARMDGLDSGARVVFRSLWDEWNKLGRWTGG